MYTPNNISSIGLRSEFLLFDHISEIYPRQNYLVVKTPRNPKYISANFILFKHPPNETDIEKWPLIFQKEFNNTNINHIKLAWDYSASDYHLPIPLLKDGFELEHYRTLIANGLLTNNKIKQDIEVRIISNEKEWVSVVEDQMLFRPEGLEEDYYKEFSQQLMSDYKSMIQSEKSIWFGAFMGPKMIGSLGLLWSDTMIAFQRVLVKPDFRMQGVCKIMVNHVLKWALNSLKAKSIVILAEKDSIAEYIYQSLGFQIEEELLAIYRYPPIK